MQLNFNDYTILTLKEVCNLVKLSPETIRKWRKLGKFPQAKPTVIHGKLLWLYSDIKKWIEGTCE